jgi:hypothetical protein
MEKKIILSGWLMCLWALGLQASDGSQGANQWENVEQLKKLGAGAVHYLQAAGNRALYQPPVIDKEWRVKNETPYTLLINGNPVEADMVLTGSGRAHKDADLVVAEPVTNGKQHFKPFTIKLLQNNSKDWTRYVAVTLKPGLMWGLRVSQRIAEYTDKDIKNMVTTYPTLKNEHELTEWQVVNRSSYNIQVDGTALAKGGKMDGKLAANTTIYVYAEQPPSQFRDMFINLGTYKGLLLRQRDQWLKIDIINKSLFSSGIDYRISREPHFALFGPHGYLTTGWTNRKVRDVFLTMGALSFLHYKLKRFWQYGNR